MTEAQKSNDSDDAMKHIILILHNTNMAQYLAELYAVLGRVSKVKWVHLGLLEWLDLRWVFLSAPSSQLERSNYPWGIHCMSHCLLPTFPGTLRRDWPHGRARPPWTTRTPRRAGTLWSLRKGGHQRRPRTTWRPWQRWTSRTERIPRRERTAWNPCEYRTWRCCLQGHANSDRCQKKNLHTDC